VKLVQYRQSSENSQALSGYKKYSTGFKKLAVYFTDFVTTNFLVMIAHPITRWFTGVASLEICSIPKCSSDNSMGDPECAGHEM
jgi:hypothetical protein